MIKRGPVEESCSSQLSQQTETISCDAFSADLKVVTLHKLSLVSSQTSTPYLCRVANTGLVTSRGKPLSSSSTYALHLMSHRTFPVFDDLAFPPRLTRATTEPTVNASQAAAKLFEAIDEARFDQARRAVTANPACLRATSQNGFTPIDYALHQAHIWNAHLEHCRRTGTAIHVTGHSSFRERLATICTIIGYLLSQPNAIVPVRTPLHIALSCKFDWLAETFLKRFPHMATSRDSGMKTPLHIACGLSGSVSNQVQTRLVQSLTRAGVDANARDCEGRTPMHELVASLSESAPPYGLIHRSHLRPSLGFVVGIVDELLISGADIYATDAKGCSPMDMALAKGQDYLLIAQRASLMRERLCSGEFSKSCTNAHVKGLWGLLPDEVVLRIFRLLSPRDVTCGIGATCVGLRRVAISEDLWRHLETNKSMAAIREGVLRSSLRDPPQV